MKIQVDKEGQQAVDALTDCALKSGGRANLEFVTKILSIVELIEEKPKDKED